MSATKRVLVLGAGRVSGPVFEDLATENDVQVTAVSVIQSELDRVGQLCPSADLKCVDITKDLTSRDKLVAEHDVIIGLVPYVILADVARACLASKKHLVTASYVDEEVKSLNQQIKEAGLTFLCEIGLDPGIDHMLAMKTFDDIRDRGGEVTSYQLWCGGLPAPEHADNPLKYKFSWYPRGSLMACCRGGGYKRKGEVITIPSGTSLLESVEDLHFTKEFSVEGFPNVYKSSYLDLYKIHTAEEFIRGTLRYKGFSNAVLGLMQLGLFEVKPHPMLKSGSSGVTWRRFLSNELELSEDFTDETIMAKLSAKVPESQIDVVKRLGLLGDEEIEPKDTPLDTLANYLEKRPDFMFGSNERDLVIMHIEIGGRFPDGSHETRNIDMVVYGDVGKHSAMAKTVGHTVASATMLLLNGGVDETGIVLPISRSFYKPILESLEKKGINITDQKG